MLSSEIQQLCRLFAATLDYPNKSLAAATQDCANALADSFPRIAAPMLSFADFVGSQSVEALEELYTQTFDVTPATSLYLGYHLFGETPHRSVFLVRLQEAYQAHSFSSGTELADNLVVLLRFLSLARDWEFARPLLEECLVPTVTKIEAELRKTESEYAPPMSSLKTLLEQMTRAAMRPGGEHNA